MKPLPQVFNLNELSIATFFCMAGLAGGSIVENLTSTFFVLKITFFIESSWGLVTNTKKLRLVLRYYWEFYKYKINLESMLN